MWKKFQFSPPGPVLGSLAEREEKFRRSYDNTRKSRSSSPPERNIDSLAGLFVHRNIPACLDYENIFTPSPASHRLFSLRKNVKNIDVNLGQRSKFPLLESFCFVIIFIFFKLFLLSPHGCPHLHTTNPPPAARQPLTSSIML